MTGIKAAAVSHVGKIRANNQDSGYSGRHLFVVADGMGGHAGGDVASALAINRILQLDQEYDSVEEARAALESALSAANTLLGETVVEHPELAGMGTTVTGFLRVGSEIALAHIGDSRAYRYRDEELEQLTNDHTFVQRLVDSGRITLEEAAVHPRRSVLMRVLGDVEVAPDIDTTLLPVRPGDRYVLCSDGLSSYVSEDKLAELLRQQHQPKQLAERMLKLALDAGAPDNVTVIVVEITDDDSLPVAPQLVGSAVAPLSYEAVAAKRSFRLSTTLLHPIKAVTAVTTAEEHFEPDSDEYLESLIAEDLRRARFRRIRWLVSLVLIVLLVVMAGVLGYRWTQTRFYVGEHNGYVAIYQGIQQDLGPIPLSSVYESFEDIALDQLPPGYRDRVLNTISAEDLGAARRIVEGIANVGLH